MKKKIAMLLALTMILGLFAACGSSGASAPATASAAVMMIFSAMVTPDASPVTMMLLFAALVGLYEIALLLARVMLRRRIRASSEDGEERMQAAEEAGIRLTEGPETKGKE